MGVAILPVFKPKVSRATLNVEGKVLAREFERLDKLAAKYKLKPFSSFGDNREIPEGFSGDPDELEEILGQCNVWYAAKEGLKTMEGLVDALQDPKNAAKFEEPELVLEALRELAKCLRLAAKKGAKFRLKMA